MTELLPLVVGAAVATTSLSLTAWYVTCHHPDPLLPFTLPFVSVEVDDD